MIISESASDYATTVKRLTEATTARGLTIFCRIDHSAAAREVGLELPPEEVFLLGNPRIGTRLMEASPNVGYELPLRIVVWQEGDRVRLAHRDPREFVRLFGLEELRGMLDQMAGLLDTLTGEATNPSV
jgi:uncharacterized protein (DUF302 family)